MVVKPFIFIMRVFSNFYTTCLYVERCEDCKCEVDINRLLKANWYIWRLEIKKVLQCIFINANTWLLWQLLSNYTNSKSCNGPETFLWLVPIMLCLLMSRGIRKVQYHNPKSRYGSISMGIIALKFIIVELFYGKHFNTLLIQFA